MAKKKLKQKMILVFLIWIVILLLPGWIAREGWKDVPGMAWFWLGIFIIVTGENFVRDYAENKKIEKINKGIKEMKKRLKDQKRK